MTTAPAFPGCAPSQTGLAVFVEHLGDLERFKFGTTYTIDVPIIFTHTGTFDFTACNLVVLNDGVTTGGALHGSNPAQKLTASTLAGPFITFRGHATLSNLTVTGVAVAFDLDGTTAGAAAALKFDALFAIGCGSIGTITAYASMIVTRAVFITCGGLVITEVQDLIFQICAFLDMTGGVVLSGSFDVSTFRIVAFQPRDGVTAISVPASIPSPTSFTGTFDISFCRFVLDFPLSVGIAVSSLVGLNPEAFDMERGLFQTSAGLPPVGTPIPPGFLNAQSNKARLTRCTNEPNSSDISYVTMAGNAVQTPVAVGGVPEKILGTTISQISDKFDHAISNRALYIGALIGFFDITFIATLSGATNRVVTVFVAVNGVAASESGVEVTMPSSGRAAPVTCTHLVTLQLGDYVEAWVTSDNGSSVLGERLVFKVLAA